jgi:hypothetical protein
LVRKCDAPFQARGHFTICGQGPTGELGTSHAIFVSRGKSVEDKRLHLQIVQIPGLIIPMSKAQSLESVPACQNVIPGLLSARQAKEPAVLALSITVELDTSSAHH